MTGSIDVPEDQPPLQPEDLGDDPMVRFREWLEAAKAAGLDQPEAMALATADPERGPAVRMVLLRGVDDAGFVFYTNRQSAKGADLAVLPRAALVFHWTRPIHRQVRIEGGVELLDGAASEAYFSQRPSGARISAWASPQSRPVADRAELDRRWLEVRAQYPDDDEIPLPPFWGGYRVAAETIEFWQGRRDRFHDRIRFRRTEAGWDRQRLAP